MSTKIIKKSKLLIPDIPESAFYCERLKALDIAGHRIVTVTAPAGYGKTIAVLLSLSEHRNHVDWYRLGKEDNSVSVFFSGLIEILFDTETEDIDSKRSMSSIGNIANEYLLLSAVICQDVWADYSPDDPDRYLVLDNFQYADENEIIHEIIHYLIDNMPPNMHVVIISRTDNFHKEKLMLRGDLLAIDQNHLLFSREETGQLFANLGIKDALQENIGTIHEYTEGWIAGIIMLMHSIGKLEFKNAKDFTGDKTSIIRYLLSEVLAGYEREEVQSAARLSLLSEFSVEDLSFIFKLDDPDEIIHWLETNNFYIQKIGETPPVYRFHSLFREALMPYIDKVYTAEEINSFHLSAAERFENTGRFVAATEQYLLAGNSKKAADLATVCGQRYMDAGDIDSAVELIYTVPKSMIHQHATLLMVLGASLLKTQTDRSLEYLEKALSMAVMERKLELAVKIQGLMISVCAQRGDFSDIKKIMSKVPVFKAMVSGRHARNMMLMNLFTKSVVTDQIKTGRILMKIINKMPGSTDLWGYSNLITKANLYRISGDFSDAENIIHKIREHPIALRNDRWRSLGLAVSCELSVLMGDRKFSQRLIEYLASIGEKYHSGFSAGSALLYTALVKYQYRDFDGALSAAEDAKDILIKSRNHNMAAFARVLGIAWSSEISEGKDFSEQAEEELNTVISLGSHYGILEHALTVTAIQYMQKGDLNRAEELLLKAYESAESKQAYQDMCGIAMHLAILCENIGDHKRAMKYLTFFGETSAEKGYIYFHEMNYRALAWVSANCVRSKINHNHMMKIISGYFGPNAVDDMIRNPSDIISDPQAFIDKHSLQKPNAPKEIRISLFGEFKLTIDGHEVDSSIWKTRKISGILKYILSRPNKLVSRETLATVFWPNSNSKAAFTSLRVALFDLRKTLAALELAIDGENPLIGEDKRGFFVCNPKFVKSDAYEFSNLYEKSFKEDLTKKDRYMIFRQMAELYKDDYFAGEYFEEWVEVQREQYRSIYIEISNKIIEYCYLYGDQSQAEKLLYRQLEIDPYDEKACRMLINLYNESGKHDQASSLTRQFAKRFKQEMGVEPALLADSRR